MTNEEFTTEFVRRLSEVVKDRETARRFCWAVNAARAIEVDQPVTDENESLAIMLAAIKAVGGVEVDAELGPNADFLIEVKPSDTPRICTGCAQADSMIDAQNTELDFYHRELMAAHQEIRAIVAASPALREEVRNMRNDPLTWIHRLDAMKTLLAAIEVAETREKERRA